MKKRNQWWWSLEPPKDQLRRWTPEKAWRAGLSLGFTDALSVVVVWLGADVPVDEALDAMRAVPELASLHGFLAKDAVPKVRQAIAMHADVKADADRLKAAEARRDSAKSALLSAAEKAGRRKQDQRRMRDIALATEFAGLIRGGHTTETARAKMKLGIDRAKRIRAVAVEHGWIRVRQRKMGFQ